MTVLTGVEGFKFGCDPELFCVNDKGELVNAAGLIPGTKQDPFKVDHGAIQVDGMALEFNIDPVDNFNDFNRNIVTVLKQLKAFLPSGYGFKIEPSVRFSPEVMSAADEVAKALGCDPDYNAWTGEVNPYPDTQVDPYLRTASGHVHIGWTENENIDEQFHRNNGFDLVKQLDWFLGAWSVQKDADPTRRQLYGKAGACRIKPYGVEYRVLSNFWLKDRDSRRQVWNRMQQAISYMQRAEYYKVYPSRNPAIRKIINESVKDHPLFEEHHFPLTRAIA